LQEFLSNTVNTGWLDDIIAKKEKTEKPNTMLGLICGALNVADQIIQSNFQSFKTSLERGQTQPATFLKNFVTVELIYDDIKYCVLTTKTGPSLFMVELAGTQKEV
jgi:acetyl-CoA carboxylase/biotin carboxylase 1